MPKSPRPHLTKPAPGRSNDPMQAVATIALERAQEGDAEGFRVLVEQNTRHVFRLAFRMTGNEADAEDVVQETFLRAYRNIARYDPRAKVSTWLHSIASNYSIDLLRKRKRRVADHLDDLPEAATPVAVGDAGTFPKTGFRGQEWVSLGTHSCPRKAVLGNVPVNDSKGVE